MPETNSTKPVVDSSSELPNGQYIEENRCACGGYVVTPGTPPHCTEAGIAENMY